MANIASILRKWEYCDIRLDSPFGKVVFDFIDEDEMMIRCHRINEDCDFIEVSFDFLGRHAHSGACVLFPEGKKDWHEGEFSFFNEGDILFVKSDEFEYVIRYAGVDENGLVIRDSVLTKDLEYRSGKSALCYLGEVSAVREASFAEIAMLLQYMAKEK